MSRLSTCLKIQSSQRVLASELFPWLPSHLYQCSTGIISEFSILLEWAIKFRVPEEALSMGRRGPNCSTLLQMCSLSLVDADQELELFYVLYHFFLLQWLTLMNAWCTEGAISVKPRPACPFFWNRSEKGLWVGVGGLLLKCFTGRMW